MYNGSTKFTDVHANCVCAAVCPDILILTSVAGLYADKPLHFSITHELYLHTYWNTPKYFVHYYVCLSVYIPGKDVRMLIQQINGEAASI